MSLQESKEVVSYLDKISQKLIQVKGKKLINFRKEQKFPHEYILTFMGLNSQDRCEITFKAVNLEILRQDPQLNSVFYKREPKEVKGKNLLKYQNWETEKLADTGNLTGPHPNLTLIFEDGYSIEIEGLYQ
jgi:hypothetical protein